uniref:EGF-like domain-containing protein n=1 Tax=Aplanochytrium stocchinoi TaxID=215587 RepID=A0A7S3LQ07_9STRA
MVFFKSWLVLAITWMRVVSTWGAFLKTAGGCSCLDSWELDNERYAYPNNCVDPSNKGFTRCMTSKSPPCFGVSMSIDWDKCEPPQRVKVPTLQEKSYSNDAIYKNFADLVRSQHLTQSKPNVDTVAALVLTGKDFPEIWVSKSLKNKLAENCDCFPGRGSCNENGVCICINQHQFIGSSCSECGHGFQGPYCTPSQERSPISLFYFFLLLSGLGLCCVLPGILHSSSKAMLSKWLGVSHFTRKRATKAEIKEFSLSTEVLISHKDKKQKQTTNAKTNTKSTTNRTCRLHDKSSTHPADEVLLDFSDDTVYEFDSYTQSYYMLHAEDYDIDSELMDSLNENGDFELEF